MSRPVPSPSTNGRIGLSGTWSFPSLIEIFAPPSGTLTFVYAILSLLVPQQLEIIGLASNVCTENSKPYHLTKLRYLRNYARDYNIREDFNLVTNIMRFVHASLRSDSVRARAADNC